MFVWFVFTCLWQWRSDSTMMGMMWQLWQLEWWLCMESPLSLFWWERTYRWSFLPWSIVWWFEGHASQKSRTFSCPCPYLSEFEKQEFDLEGHASHVLSNYTAVGLGHLSLQFARMKWLPLTLTHCCLQVPLVVVQTIGVDLGLTALWIQAMVSFSKFSIGKKHKCQTCSHHLPPKASKVVLSYF